MQQLEEESVHSAQEEDFEQLQERFGDQSKEEKIKLRSGYLEIIRQIDGKFLVFILIFANVISLYTL